MSRLVTAWPRWLALLVLAPACRHSMDDLIARDADGCWTDPYQAHEEYSLRYCDARCKQGYDAETIRRYEARCMEWQEYERQQLSYRACFDGCTVDACLDAWDRYLDTCDEALWSGLNEQCRDGPEAVWWSSDNHPRWEGEQCDHWW